MLSHDLLIDARALVRAEGEALIRLADSLDDRLLTLAQRCATCSGHIILTGAGTSGTVAYRIAHLLATCEMPAFFIPPGDALHGESAILKPGDVLIALSKAGKSADINEFARIARDRGAYVVGWTASPDSPLAQLCHLVVQLDVDSAAEGEGLLPMGSTLVNGAYGDALVLVAKRMRGFDLRTLEQTHPQGGFNESAQRQAGGQS